ncbi:hypothetical protein EDD18DRAFT_849472 [Armillaria luteobubalina]|uniref:CFEM domain-containing protein n=1 Tax=Armillaria luteobubalina TaxID=153913 RepID=A0AA39QBP9_9AGAR|nr:hypothetical protein EDD18DRAFT_849472 [Armillaria luteobubalina]
MRLESFHVLSVCLLCFVLAVQGQSSTTTSITAGSATRTTISDSTTTRTSPGNTKSINLGSSGNLSASSTLSAKLPTLSGYSTCVTNCLQLSIADANCTSVADVNCFCPRTEFTSGLTNCVVPLCPNELPTAETLAQSFCTLASTSTSLSFSVTSIFSSSSSSLTIISTSAIATRSSSSSIVTDSKSSALSASNTFLGGTRAAWCAFAAILGLIVGRIAMH